MGIFVSTFISGLQEPVTSFLRQDIPGIKILDVYDGLVVYKADVEQHRIAKLRYFNNSFLLLKKFTGSGYDSLEQMIAETMKDRDLGKKMSGLRNQNRSFRIITSKENQLTAVNKDILSRMERAITGLTGLKANRAKPDYEFWFLYRSEEVGFFMLRLTRHASYDKILHKGELRPEMCHILCRLAKPDNDDIFLDPFCGYGAIPLERIHMHPFNMIFMSDADAEQVRYCKEKIKELDRKSKNNIIVRQSDALSLDKYEDGFFDSIVTDPPWGLYKDTGMDITEFYSLMLREFARVLKHTGTIVILTAQKEAFESAAEKQADNPDRGLAITCKYNILVSGKKASIYILKHII